jgi:hypothetical protein
LSEDRPKRKSWREFFSRDATQTTTTKRRSWLRVGIAVLVVVVFIAVPGYIASKPQFLHRYEKLSGQYDTWSTSVHAQVPCQSCHIPPKRTSQLAYNARMLGEFYLSLVVPSRQPKVFAAPTNEACQSCHIDLRTVSPSGDLNIPHRAHVAVLKLKCVDCHNDLVHTTNAAGTHTPSMVKCLTCHDGRSAKRDCSACHTNKRAPESHRAADWLIVHPQEQKRDDCTKCHKWTANWCADCHSSRPRSHTKTWRSDHGAAVKSRRTCEACHEASFCIRCHGELPSLNFDPALKLVK